MANYPALGRVQRKTDNKDRVVTLDTDGQSLEQVGRLVNIAGCRTQSPTHLT